MLNKILAFAVLSLALLLQPAWAKPQQNDRGDDSFIQILSTLDQQQKIQLLDEWARGVNERYPWGWKTDVLQGGRVSHELPEKPQITYTVQFQPALRPLLDRNRERVVQSMKTVIEQNIPCFQSKTVEAMNRLGVRQIHVLFRLENETVWEQVRDFPVCR